MSWFQDAFMWPQLLLSSDGRDKLKNDIKYGEGVASVGSPLHGLTAGYKLHELMSPTVHINDRIQNIRKDGFGSDHLKWAVDDQNHNLQDAFKENIPALTAFIGGGAGGAFGGGGSGAAGGAGSASGSGGLLSAGDAAAMEAAGASAGMSGTSGTSAASGMGMSAPAQGVNWGGMAQQGLGLLGQAGAGQQQQQPAAVSPPPQQQQNNSLQQRVAMQKRIQQLRQKPRKTLAEQQELQELMRNSQGLL